MLSPLVFRNQGNQTIFIYQKMLNCIKLVSCAELGDSHTRNESFEWRTFCCLIEEVDRQNSIGQIISR